MKSYSKANIGEDETVIYESKISVVPLINYIIPIILFVVAIYIVNNIWFSVLSIFVIFLCIIFLIRTIIKLSAIELVITNKRIIGKTGIINIKILEAPLSKVTMVSIKKGLLGHIFNYGHIIINVFSCKYEYKYMKKPEVFKNKLMSLI